MGYAAHPRVRRGPCRTAALILVVLAGVANAADPVLHHVAVDGHPIAVWSKPSMAEKPGATILLIHGRTWSARPDFDLQTAGVDVSLMDGLRERGFTTYAVDLRGYGATGRDATGWLTPERAAADAVAVLRWVARRHPTLDAPAVFGWSYGSMVAQLALQTAPDAASALVLFGYPVRPGIDTTVEPLPEEPPRTPTTAAGAASDFITPSATDPRVVDSFVAAALHHDPIRADWRRLDQWRELDGALILTPTLLLQAEHDPLALTDVHARFFERLRTADKQWTAIPGGDHAAFLESPRTYFLDVMARFLTAPRHD